MKTASLSNLYSGLIIAVLVILTAWGNAVAMLVVSALAVAIGLLLFGRDFARRGAVVAVLVCVMGVGRAATADTTGRGAVVAVLVCVIAFFVGFLLQRS